MQPTRNAVVTGATGGIGRHIALGLSLAGYRVALIGRSRQRLDLACHWIAAAHPGAALETEQAELSSLEQTRRAGRRLAERLGAIDLLMLNAGTFETRRVLTEEGHERVLAVNHLSPFVLVETLGPALAAASGGGHIVTVGSSSSDRATLDPDDLERARGWGMQRAYAGSKLAVMMATFEWAERLPGTASVVHPGLVRTAIAAKGGVVGLAWSLIGRFGLSEAEGARTPLYVASLGADVPNGRYWKRCAEARPNPLADDPALRRRVWQATTRLVGSGDADGGRG